MVRKKRAELRSMPKGIADATLALPGAEAQYQSGGVLYGKIKG
jgi:hypothetical protein